MTMPPLPEQEEREEREPDNVGEPGASERSNEPARLTGGAWFSLAVSFGFFLLMVAIGVKYHVAAQSRDEPAEPDRYVVANASVPAIAAAPTSQPDAYDTLLAQARECAAAAQWDCVIETTSGAIAQRGNTPETKALLSQAIVKGGWVPANAHNVREVSTMPPESKRPTLNGHRHTARAERLRYAAMTRRHSMDEMADIYRH
ncbi:hypothetical protein LMG28688_02670 [Paraburkholderia caffeinitolerans]|uniref:Uncharacterized protein n=1 Tax=Paraburkholderia caffeinitolerans TaxID=1723730 RepID=A0A6J5FWP9_9BURK|nr:MULTISPECIES: hypothetical protein [Paraburkholderia]CAB3788346.1 hypothetical protein LMG28688_02670 [Paraburkholderia caffeinitolerans]